MIQQTYRNVIVIIVHHIITIYNCFLLYRNYISDLPVPLDGSQIDEVLYLHCVIYIYIHVDYGLRKNKEQYLQATEY